MKKPSAKKIANIALLIAMEIVLTRFVSIQTPILRISLGFIPVAVTGMAYGPFYAGIGAAIGDLIGVALFPAGPFFPGFTLTALLTGVVYGLLLYGRAKSLWRVCLAAAAVTIGLQLGLDTFWLQIITGKGYLALLPARVAKAVIMTPIQIGLIRFVASERFYKRIFGKRPVAAE
jgi:ECF transporter S component (folate family)